MGRNIYIYQITAGWSTHFIYLNFLDNKILISFNGNTFVQLCNITEKKIIITINKTIPTQEEYVNKE